MMITEFLAGLTLTTKIVAGVGAVAVTGAAAGAAGVLPIQAESAIEHSTETSTEADVSADPADVVIVTTETGDEASEFGARVAAEAREGGVDGPSVAAEARTQGKAGLDKADSTPAADHRPEDVPAGPPASLPVEAEVEIEANAEGAVHVPTDPTAAAGERNPLD
jgi:hypothetical protein